MVKEIGEIKAHGSCTIGKTRFGKAMLDLGASINVMPYSVFASLNLGTLKETGVVIQLADRSNAYPRGVLEDVLVQLNELVFPEDFYGLDMEDEGSPMPTPLLLDRPFMKTARTKIDVYNGTLTMEFDGEVVRFNIFEAMRYPSDVHSCFKIDTLDVLAQQIFELDKEDALEVVMRNGLVSSNIPTDVELDEDLKETVAALETIPRIPSRYATSSYISLPLNVEKLLPSIMHAPTLDLKPLPDHLKYVFLGENKTLPVIIANNLSSLQEEKLMRVLMNHRTVIGWTIADIKGISPSMCMHRILLEDGAMPTREAQRRLNPLMMDVVKKEILKLLDVGVIYPILDNKWTSLVQVVPKKFGVTIVKNNDDIFVPTKVQTGWRACIDYRKLNSRTRKDHFPYPL